tara:strand:- start:135 stop:1586 length:1452 start_codon:yes stop_codon:yes gene_type:complete
MSVASISVGTSGILTPSMVKQTSSGSYLDFTSSGVAGWAQQYVPELYESEVERYGDRSIGGFLKVVGAEMPMASDQVVWSEQGRLHLAYKAVLDTNACTVGTIVDIDDETETVAHALRVGTTVVCQIADGTGDVAVVTAQVTDAGTDGADWTMKPYGAATFDALDNITDVTNATLYAYAVGSDFAKGSENILNAVEPEFKSFTNKPIIIKDRYVINGSDTAQIGWVEVSGEAGQSGYLWYLKAEGDTRKRFEDYLEMSVIEGRTKNATGSVSVVTGTGTEGLFEAIEDRGMVATNMFDTADDDLADFDSLIGELDKQGAIEENMLFLDRTSNLGFDNMLAAVNSNYEGGSAYGVFNNDKNMALNLGFTGFRRGSYDFYKTDWKYLNNKSGRGLVNSGATAGKVAGVLIPAGTSSVYDQGLGKNIKRPFLHVRYRASEADDRKLKTWITGSVGAANSSVDDMNIHYLSERCLVTQAANNFVLFR